MKIWLLFLHFLVQGPIFPGPGLPVAGISLVSHVSVGQTSGSNATSSAINTSGASLLVAMVSSFGGIGTVSDSNSNTWTALGQVDDGSSGTTGRLFYVGSPVVGSGHTFTIGGSVFSSLCVAAFSGIPASPFDKQVNQGNVNVVTSFKTVSTITPTNANSLVIAGSALGGNGNTFTSIDSSFTFTDKTTGTAAALAGSLAYLIQTSIVAENPTVSWTTGAKSTLNQAVFK
jgi:hypothetical protein